MALVLSVLAMLLSPPTSASASAQAAPTALFGYETVQREAQRLAAEPYREPDRAAVSPELRRLSYDQYQAIRFRPEAGLWHSHPGFFRAHFFPVGFIFTKPVTINLVSADGAITPIVPRAEMYDWSDALRGMPGPERVSFAGFKLLFPLHRPDQDDEVAAFLGASYFRILGREQAYGISARGLAIDTGLPRQEEFPYFRAFWLVTPAEQAREITLFALLDSPGLAGAYRFVLRPGTETTVDVTATLYPRHGISVLGIAPLTSMFLAGENDDRRRDPDFRPEVHDSDGLLVETRDGERLWRPLINPRELRISSFVGASPRGFGLLQRDRDFRHYQDLQARYHRRPSYWVEPLGDWGEGEVRLVEIPSKAEIHDNIAAFWVAREPVTGRGQVIERRYRLRAFTGAGGSTHGGRAVATQITAAHLPGLGAPSQRRTRRFVVEFAGGELDILRPEQPVIGEVSLSAGTLVQAPRIEAMMPERRAWRLIMEVEPTGKTPVEMRAYLRLYDETLTETWTYLWQP